MKPVSTIKKSSVAAAPFVKTNKAKPMSLQARSIDEDQNAPVLAYTSLELQQLYRVPRHTWYRWMKKHREAIGPREGHFFTIKQVRIIFEILDPPPALVIEEGEGE